ncbi:MAG: hypothetical protein ACYTEK_18495 [Planctomycetota bacterium]|jgi:hypothetical protein
MGLDTQSAPRLLAIMSLACAFRIKAILLEAVEGRRLKLGDSHPRTLESWNNLIALYEARNKPEEAKKWRAKLPQTEAGRE